MGAGTIEATNGRAHTSWPRMGVRTLSYIRSRLSETNKPLYLPRLVFRCRTFQNTATMVVLSSAEGAASTRALPRAGGGAVLDSPSTRTSIGPCSEESDLCVLAMTCVLVGHILTCAVSGSVSRNGACDGSSSSSTWPHLAGSRDD